MITIYARVAPNEPLSPTQGIAPNDERALWIDLENPTDAEESFVETALALDVPTHAERGALEESARFYEENGALIMTATLLGRRDDGPFISDAVMFVLIGNKLVTVRTIRPRAFEIGEGRASARVQRAQSGADVLMALLDGVGERLADRIAEATREMNELASQIFSEQGAAGGLRENMRKLGLVGSLLAQALDSLSSVKQLVNFAIASAGACDLDRARLEAMRRDAQEVERAGLALQDRLVFLLDAAVGLVSVNQNEILKALSVATIAFVPPTLIASIFGMNFEHMTWFQESWGPWIGFALMLAAPAALFGLAKWRRW
ncbi:MAG: CorA family divalent cation transporter, partial [Caulobacterales bacterium]